MGVGGDQQGSGQAAGDQVGEEGVPRLFRFAGSDFDTQDFAVPVGVDTGRDQHDRVDDPTLLADFHSQGVGGDEGERPRLVQGPGAERVDLGVEVGGHPRDLRLRQAGDAQGLHEFVHPAGRDAEEIAGGDHADQGGFGSLTAFQEPVGEVRAGPQFGDGDVDGAGAGVELAVAVAVTGVDPLRRHGPVFGAADRVGLSRQQRVDDGGQQVPHQIR